jgi:hypothetical protein
MTRTRYFLKSIRLNTGVENDRGELFGSREQAQAEALARNCKPFTPFYWFVVEA